jgi:hypothetical protein
MPEATMQRAALALSRLLGLQRVTTPAREPKINLSKATSVSWTEEEEYKYIESERQLA